MFDRYLAASQFCLSTYLFSNLFMWRNINDIRYVVYENCLVILKKDFNDSYHFIEPININVENFNTVVGALTQYAAENKFTYLFREVSWNFAWRVKTLYCSRVILTEDRDNFDYIYKISDLINLKGNKYKSQRNHYNHFLRNEKYKSMEMCDSNITDCIRWLENWKPSHENKSSEIEKAAVLELLNSYSFLNLKGIAVYIKNNLEGFAIGEPSKKDMAVVHVEKANSKINGLYSYLNKILLEVYFKETMYVNREEDLGISGLRKAKMSYYPLWLEASYSVMLNMEYSGENGMLL